MAISVHRKNFGSYFWQTSGPNKVLSGALSTSTDLYYIDPEVITTTLSGTPYSTFSRAQIEANFKHTSSSDVTVTDTNFLDSNWAAKGWTTSDDFSFFGQMKKFVQNNYSQYQPYNDAVLVLSRGYIYNTDPATSLLLHFNNNLNDSSQYLSANVNTYNNNVAFLAGKFSQGGNFNGTDSRVDFSAFASSGIYDFGSGSFTIDFWFNTSSLVASDKYVIGGTWKVALNNGQVVFDAGGGISLTSSGGPYTINVWNHVAIVRNVNDLTIYLNGVSIGNTTVAGAVSFSNSFSIGSNNAGGNFYSGSLDEIRITKGSALWATGFVAPTAAYDLPLHSIPFLFFGNLGDLDNFTTLMLHFDSSSAGVHDSSSNNHTISISGNSGFSSKDSKFGYSSAYFHGTHGTTDRPDNFLNLQPTAALTMGTDLFTLECWFNFSLEESQTIWCQNNGFSQYALRIHDGVMGYYATTSAGGNSWNMLNGNTGGNSVGTIPILPNTWTHVAFVRDTGNVWRGYINGQLDMTVTVSGSLGTSSQPFRIGGWTTPDAGANTTGSFGYPAKGFIDELRVSKGVARYSGASFAVPTAPFVSDANTSFLGHFETTGILDSSNNNHPSFVFPTSAVISSYGPGKFINDGTGVGTSATFTAASLNYFPVVGQSQFFDYGASDFNCDFWFNTTSSGGNIFSHANAAIIIGDTTNRQIVMSFFGQNVTSHNLLWGVNTWNHISICRKEFTQFLYVNGLLSGVSQQTNVNSPNVFAFGPTSLATSYSGKLDDLRISNVARYSPTFTPPVAPYSDDANTSILLHMDSDFTDSSSNAITVTTGGAPSPTFVSGKFSNAANFAGGFANIPTGAVSGPLDLGAGDFTIDLWVNPSSYPSAPGLNYIYSSPNMSLALENNTGQVPGSLQVNFSSIGAFSSNFGSIFGAFSIPLNTWTHIALVNYSTVPSINGVIAGQSNKCIVLYVNGNPKMVIPHNTTMTFTASNTFRLGAEFSAAAAATKFNGSIDEFRISKGITRWTGNFTPSVAPFGS